MKYETNDYRTSEKVMDFAGIEILFPEWIIDKKTRLGKVYV